MSSPKATDFTAFEFTKDEYPLAVTFTELQVQHLQSERAQVAMQELAVEVDPDNHVKSQLEAMYFRGWRACITYLLQLHDTQRVEAENRQREAIAGQENDIAPTKRNSSSF